MAYTVSFKNVPTYETKNKTSTTTGWLNIGCEFSGKVETVNNVKWIKVTSATKSKYTGTVVGSYCLFNDSKNITEKKTTSVTDAATSAADAASDSTNALEDNNIYNDDFFTKVYSNIQSVEDYKNSLDGLNITNLRGIMGLPHQFLPNTDSRIDFSDEDKSIGRVFSDKIIAPMPLLFMTPGTPSFMSSFNNTQKTSMLTALTQKGISGLDDNSLSSLIDFTGGKYYSLKYAYIEYFSYVNAMLRSAAFYLGIDDETLSESETNDTNQSKLGSLNWYFCPNGVDTSEDNDLYDNNGLSKYIGTYAGAVPFYIEADTRISDSFANSTTQSQLAGMIDGLSDTARELNYIIGNGAGALGAGTLYDEIVGAGGELLDKFTSDTTSILGGNNLLSNIAGKLKTILSGGRMVFPEIWSDSSFSRSYSVNLKLVSPSGDKLSIFYNILVPIYHLMAFVLPRKSDVDQSFFSPFLVRAYYKGIFNIDMGIITDMTIQKGADGEWTPDGLPTTAEVSFEIKDLYDSLSMSAINSDKDTGILSNICELDYIANSCGININEPEITRTVKMAYYLGLYGRIKDSVTMGIFGSAGQYFNQKVQNIFGTF